MSEEEAPVPLDVKQKKELNVLFTKVILQSAEYHRKMAEYMATAQEVLGERGVLVGRVRKTRSAGRHRKTLEAHEWEELESVVGKSRDPETVYSHFSDVTKAGLKAALKVLEMSGKAEFDWPAPKKRASKKKKVEDDEDSGDGGAALGSKKKRRKGKK